MVSGEPLDKLPTPLNPPHSQLETLNNDIDTIPHISHEPSHHVWTVPLIVIITPHLCLYRTG